MGTGERWGGGDEGAGWELSVAGRGTPSPSANGARSRLAAETVRMARITRPPITLRRVMLPECRKSRCWRPVVVGEIPAHESPLLPSTLTRITKGIIDPAQVTAIVQYITHLTAGEGSVSLVVCASVVYWLRPDPLGLEACKA